MAVAINYDALSPSGADLLPSVILDKPIEIFAETGRASIAGANFNYTYRAPANQEEVTDPVPLLISHGWGGTELAYADLGEAVAELGKPSLTFNAPRSQGQRDLNPLSLLRVSKLSSQAAWAVMRDSGFNLFDVYGHSKGGQTAVDVAMHKPAHVRAVILDGSCGLDRHSFSEMLGRTKEFSKEELAPSLGKLAANGNGLIALQLAHYIFRNPGRTLAEGVDAAITNLHKRLQALGELGIKRVALHSRHDRYFPLDLVERDARDLFDVFFTRADPESNHLDPILRPKTTALVISEALSQVNLTAQLKAVA